MIIISIALLGTFHEWNILFILKYLELTFASVPIFLLASEIFHTQIDYFYGKVDEFNERHFTMCSDVTLECIGLVFIGALIYAVLIGVILSAQVAIDAAIASPQSRYFINKIRP